jgi:hypothetical protein
MGKDMDKLRGMALATRARALAEQAERQPPPQEPVIPGVRMAGAAPNGQLRSSVTMGGRLRRRQLFADMLRHLPRETLAKLAPHQRAQLKELARKDGGR